MCTSLIEHELIRTTLAKAKELRPYAEELITIARQNTVASRRQVESRMANNSISKKISNIIAPQYLEVNGGYTRIIKLDRRPSDGSKMAAIELISK